MATVEFNDPKTIRFRIDLTLLEQMLGLPDDIHIVETYPTGKFDFGQQHMWIRIVGEQFKALRLFDEIPEITPVIHTDDKGQITKWEFEYND